MANPLMTVDVHGIRLASSLMFRRIRQSTTRCYGLGRLKWVTGMFLNNSYGDGKTFAVGNGTTEGYLKRAIMLQMSSGGSAYTQS